MNAFEVGACAIALLLTASGGAAAEGKSGEFRPAAGGVRIFHALETAPASVVGIVRTPTALDGESYAARLEVEVSLAGRAKRGETLSLAWEELSRARPVRFVDGERLLVSLERLPGDSIWRQRLPDGAARVKTWSIAERGDAFVRDPSPGAVKLIEHFLALPTDLRDGNPGVAHLVLMAEGARPELAYGAVERLSNVVALDAALDPVSGNRFVAALIRDDERLAAAMLDIVEARKPEGLRAPLVARSAPDASGPAVVYAALGRLDGRLDGALAEALLAREGSAAHRRVGARHADSGLGMRLARLLRADPSPEVRSAAVVRLVELDGSAAIDRLLFALDDDDVSVRATAMREIGGLGADAVPALVATANGGTPQAGRSAVSALRATGAAGLEALQEIAAAHPDASVQMAAEIALGRPIGHRH